MLLSDCFIMVRNKRPFVTGWCSLKTKRHLGLAIKKSYLLHIDQSLDNVLSSVISNCHLTQDTGHSHSTNSGHL